MPTPWTNCSTSPGDLVYLGDPLASDVALMLSQPVDEPASTSTRPGHEQPGVIGVATSSARARLLSAARGSAGPDRCRLSRIVWLILDHPGGDMGDRGQQAVPS